MTPFPPYGLSPAGGLATRSPGIVPRYSGGDADQAFGALPMVDLEGLFAFALFAPIIFIVELGTYGAILFTFATLAYALFRRDIAKSALRYRWFFLIFPAYVVASTIWSDVPSETLKHSLEFAITVFAALLIASSPNPRATLFGIFAAFALHTVISLAMGNVVAVGDNGTTALSGLDDSKNQQADTVATGFVITAFLFWAGLRRRSLLQCAITGAIGALQIYAVIAARSSGALAGLCVAIGVFAVLALLRNMSQIGRGLTIVIAGLSTFAVGAVLLIFTDDVLDWLSTSFGKDPTLTGRTYLWSRAKDLVVEHPLFGEGFVAFWQQGNLDAEGLWQFAHITSRDGFNFHSTMYDILVALGFVGLFLFVVTLVVGLCMVAARYVRNPNLLTCFWLSLGVYIVVRMPIETIGTYEFYFSTVLLFAILASGIGQKERVPSGRYVSVRPGSVSWPSAGGQHAP